MKFDASIKFDTGIFQQKEQELLQSKHEEERRQHEQNWRADNYTVDGETGQYQT